MTSYRIDNIAYYDATPRDPFASVVYVRADPRDADEFSVVMGVMIAESFCAFNFLGFVDQAGFFHARRASVRVKGHTKLGPQALVTYALDLLDAMCKDDEDDTCFINQAYDPLTMFDFTIDGPARTS